MKAAGGWIQCVGGVYNRSGMLQRLRFEVSGTVREFIDLRRALRASRKSFDGVYEENDGY